MSSLVFRWQNYTTHMVFVRDMIGISALLFVLPPNLISDYTEEEKKPDRLNK